MTLALCVMTHDWAIQVVDQRVSLSSGKLVNDHRNKMVQYDNVIAFTYSGLADLGGVPTDQWLVTRLSGTKDIYGELPGVAESLAKELGRVRLPLELKRLAIIGTGYAEFPDCPGIRPVMITISNALTQANEWEPKAQAQFTISAISLRPTTPLLVQPLGARVEASAIRSLTRNIRRCIKAGAHPSEIVRIAAEEVWCVAERNRTVGGFLTAVVLPKIGVMSNASGLFAPPSRGGPPSLPYFLSLGRAWPQRTHVSPAFTNPHLTVLESRIVNRSLPE